MFDADIVGTSGTLGNGTDAHVVLVTLWMMTIIVVGGCYVEDEKIITTKSLLRDLVLACRPATDREEILKRAINDIFDYDRREKKLAFPIYLNKDGKLFKLDLIK